MEVYEEVKIETQKVILQMKTAGKQSSSCDEIVLKEEKSNRHKEHS